MRYRFLALALLAGCGPDAPVAEPGRESVDLLARTPQTAVEQPGVIRAGDEVGFGAHDVAGWLSTPDPVASGGFAVASRARTSVLALPVLDAGDRTIELDVVASIGRSEATDGEPLAVEIRLNQRAIGTAHLQGGAERVSLEVPADLWRTARDPSAPGSNTLEFLPATVERRRARDDGTEASWYALSLRAVRYAEPRRIERTDAGLSLAPGTAATWIVEGAGRFELEGVFESAVEETALVELLAHDRVQDVRRPARVRLPLAVGPRPAKPFALTYEGAREAPFAVRVSWPLDARAPLVVRALRAEQDAHARGSLPPIVFVSVDTLAAHALGLYGSERATSPNLERFARDAVVFDAARANAPWTVPSYVSQFTGLLPAASERSEARSAHERFRLAPQRWTLAELLDARGYACEAIVDNPWLRSIAGVEQGFQRFDDEPSTRHLDDVDGGMRLVFPRGLERLTALAETSRAPFLFLQVLDVHGTYFTPDDVTGRFGSREARDGDAFLTVQPDGDQRAGFVQRYIAQSLGEPISEDGGERVSRRRLTAAYDEGVADFDREFGRLVDGLRRRGLYDASVIVVTADHGEATADDPWPFTHKYPLESTLRVPLLVKLPDSRYGGTRVSDAVTLVDLYPTLAELAGVTIADERFDGRSLVPLMRGDPLTPRPSIATHGGFEGRSIVVASHMLVEYEHRRLSSAEFLSYAPLFEAWKAFDPNVARRLEADGFQPRPDDAWIAGGDDRVRAAPWNEALRTSRRRFAAQGGLHRELYVLGEDGPSRVALDSDELRERAFFMGERLRVADERASDLSIDQVAHVDESGLVDTEELRRLGYIFEPEAAPAGGAAHSGGGAAHSGGDERDR